ncbi:MAG: HD domain-containing protein [Chromatiaceae bacterium]|jgi:hypothetical protein
MNDLIARARQFATEAHERIDQRRKYTQQPYQVHLKSVAQLVAGISEDAEMIAAAWLHDTVEDTPATFGDLERELGLGVAQLLADLTDVSKPSDGKRSARNAIDRNHTAQASPRAKTIKLADLIDNCRDICRHDPSFARIYLAEAAALLEVLAEGDAALYQLAQRSAADCARRIGLPKPPQTIRGRTGGAGRRALIRGRRHADPPRFLLRHIDGRRGLRHCPRGYPRADRPQVARLARRIEETVSGSAR